VLENTRHAETRTNRPVYPELACGEQRRTIEGQANINGELVEPVKILFHKFILAGVLQMPNILQILGSFYLSPATFWKSSIPHQSSSIDIQSSNSLMNLLTNLITPLHLSRELYKSTLFLQNKAKFRNDEMNVSSYITKGSVNFRTFCRRKNKAKQTQIKPNFRPKLASFFKYWLCFSPKSAVKRYPKELFCGLRRLCGYEISQNFLKKDLTNLTLYYRVLCSNNCNYQKNTIRRI